MKYSQITIKRTLNIYKWFNIIILVLSWPIIFVLLAAVLGNRGNELPFSSSSVIFFIAYATSYMYLIIRGISKKRSWLPTLIFYGSVISFISQINYYVFNLEMLSKLGFRHVTMIVTIALLHFFTRKEVTEHFGTKNIFLGK